MMTRHIVEFNSVAIEIIQNGHTKFVAFTVVRLRLTTTENKNEIITILILENYQAFVFKSKP